MNNSGQLLFCFNRITNNPKYLNRITKQLKAYAASQGFDENYDPYKAAYSKMPSHASSNPEIKQLYINGHFCYVYKFGVVTNGLGIIRHVSLYNKDFLKAHPEITVEKKSDSPDEDKSVHDSRLLIPTLKDFFCKHPLINPKTFLGDSAFDSVQLYKDLLSGDTFGEDKHFSRAYIPLNGRSHLENVEELTSNVLNLSALKSNGLTTNPQRNVIVNASVKIPARHLNVVEWYMPILKKT